MLAKEKVSNGAITFMTGGTVNEGTFSKKTVRTVSKSELSPVNVSMLNKVSSSVILSSIGFSILGFLNVEANWVSRHRYSAKS